MLPAQTVDFDPHSLRRTLPAAVSRIAEAARAGAAGVGSASMGRTPVACAVLPLHVRYSRCMYARTLKPDFSES